MILVGKVGVKPSLMAKLCKKKKIKHSETKNTLDRILTERMDLESNQET